MDNQLKQFSAMGSEENWRTQGFRQSVVSKIEQVIQHSGMQVARNSSEMENHVFMKAKTREEYMNMVAKLILHVREMSQPKQNQGAPNMQGPNQNPPGPNQQVSNQPGQQQSGPNSQSGMAPDPINALQNLASQGSRNQMMNMGPQGQMQQQLGPNPGMGSLQSQMGQQGPIVSQGQAQTATNLLQTLNQRPQLNMPMQNKLTGGMGMVPNQGQMGPMGGQMGGMNPMGSQLQNQLAGPMQSQMMPSMSMSNAMQVPMSGSSTMGGQMPCNQVGGMGQMAPSQMQGQMGPGPMGNSPTSKTGAIGSRMKLRVRQYWSNKGLNKCPSPQDETIDSTKKTKTEEGEEEDRDIRTEPNSPQPSTSSGDFGLRSTETLLNILTRDAFDSIENDENGVLYGHFQNFLCRSLVGQLRLVRPENRLKCYLELLATIKKYIGNADSTE